MRRRINPPQTGKQQSIKVTSTTASAISRQIIRLSSLSRTQGRRTRTLLSARNTSFSLDRTKAVDSGRITMKYVTCDVSPKGQDRKSVTPFSFCLNTPSRQAASNRRTICFAQNRTLKNIRHLLRCYITDLTFQKSSNQKYFCDVIELEPCLRAISQLPTCSICGRKYTNLDKVKMSVKELKFVSIIGTIRISMVELWTSSFS